MADLTRVIPELTQRINGMIAEGAAEGLQLVVACGFRPLADQERLYTAYQAYKRDPKHAPWAALAAVPGTSNHGKVVDGVQQDATAVDLDVVPQTPQNLDRHAQLANKWGLYRAVRGEYWHLELNPHPGPMPNQPTQPAPEAEDMADPLTIEYKNTGHKTIANVAGGIRNAGTPFFGAIGDVHPDDKKDFTAVYALTAVDLDDENAGYIVWNIAPDGHAEQFKFDRAWADANIR